MGDDEEVDDGELADSTCEIVVKAKSKEHFVYFNNVLD